MKAMCMCAYPCDTYIILICVYLCFCSWWNRLGITFLFVAKEWKPFMCSLIAIKLFPWLCLSMRMYSDGFGGVNGNPGLK